MLLPFLLALGGETAISGDRSGLLVSSTLVPTGLTQLETGLSYDSLGGVWSTPTSLRYGLCDDLELRASTTGWNHLEDAGDQGFGPLTLGVKGPIDLSFADLDLSWADSAAWVAEVELPGGTLDGAPHSLSPSATAVVSWTPDGGMWQVSSLLGVAYQSDAESIHVNMAASASRPLWDTGSVFFEAGWFPRSLLEPDPLYVGGGLILLPNTDVQLDLGFDLGLGETSGEWLAGLGVAWRW
ncbi:MAG: transporter [Planctomycetes bacterium]|nr:transporter [Planctomycetota bacterium]